MRSIAARVLLSLAALALTACNPPTATPSPTAPSLTASPSGSNGPAASAPPTTAAGSPDRVAGWQSDIAQLVPGMARLHPDLYHGVSEDALANAAAALAATAPTASDDELLDGVLRVVAMVSAGGCDAHTGAFVWGSGTYPVDSLPLRLWLFGDDLVIVDGLGEHHAMAGSRITSMEGHPTADVLEALDPLVPRDNEQTVRLLLPRFALIPQILRGLNVADAGPITLVLDHGEGTPASTVDIEPVPMATYNGWAGAYGLHLPADPNVLYLSRIDDALWWQVLDDGETLFVQHNRVDRLGSNVVADLGVAMRDPAIERVVLDLRHNFGGELHALDPIVALFQDAAFDRPGRLFIATGRNTFSAASLLVARLQRDTAAEIVGEAMGGCPTFWSNPDTFTLPASGIEISVSSELAIGVEAADTRHGILPDATLELTLDDWLAGTDPVLDAFPASGP